MNHLDFSEDSEAKSFLRRNRARLIFAALFLAVIGFGVFFLPSHRSTPSTHKVQEIVVHLQPPPPLPPPPPPPPQKVPPPPEPKMVEQPPVNKPEPKPKEPEKAPEHPPATPGPVISGTPSDFGLGPGSGGTGTGIGDAGGGSKYGWYAAKVQEAIVEAMRKNPQTYAASLHVKVRVWSDQSGRITRASMAESTGDVALDDAIKNQVLTGLVLPEAPPSDMPMPIVLRLNAQRPN